MIPFNNKLCEILEAVMAKQPENKNIQTFHDTVLQFMMQTNGILQRNLERWEDEKIRQYGVRIARYGNIAQAFVLIREGRAEVEFLEMCIIDGKSIYNDLDAQFFMEWVESGEERREQIVEEVLLPHKLLIRFLEKYKQNKSDQKSTSHSFKFHSNLKHSGHDQILKFFKRHPFGSNNPVMTFLSILAPKDRCVILEELYNPNGLDSILNDKLLLAYVTSGRPEFAEKVIEQAELNGESDLNIWGLRQKLDVGLAPIRNRTQRVSIYNDFLGKSQDLIELEFLNLLIDFCNEHYE